MFFSDYWKNLATVATFINSSQQSKHEPLEFLEARKMLYRLFHLSTMPSGATSSFDALYRCGLRTVRKKSKTVLTLDARKKS